MGLVQKIFGTHSENELKRIYPIVDRVEALDLEMQKLSDGELKAKTPEFKERLENGE
ncbi:MAG: preprotein translocase SecA, partial [Lachnospiraceae bacterium]